MNISLLLFFAAGLASFLSPCVLSLIPVYLGLLGFESGQPKSSAKAILPILIFFLGFTLVFLTLGLTATLLGNLLFSLKVWIARIGGVLIFLFGLQLTGWVNIPFLNFEKKVQVNTEKGHLLGAFLLGVFFSAGWSPCIGPILGSLLTALVIQNASIAQGLVSLLAYSLGLALPFLLAGLGLFPLLKKLVASMKVMHYIQVVSGIILCLSGLLLAFGVYSQLAQFAGIFNL